MVFLIFLASLVAIEVVLQRDARRYPLKQAGQQEREKDQAAAPLATETPASAETPGLFALAQALNQHGAGVKPAQGETLAAARTAESLAIRTNK